MISKEASLIEKAPDRPLPYYAILDDGMICFLIYEVPAHDCFIGFPKSIPINVHRNGILTVEYIREVGSYAEWFTRPQRDSVGKYLKYIPAFDAQLFCFPKKNISKIIHPLDYREIISKKGVVDALHVALTKKIIEELSRVAGVDEAAIGVEGSTLLGTFSDKSDIDILVYGFGNAKKVADNFYRLENEDGVRLYGEGDKALILKRRASLGYGDTEWSIFEQEKRRFYGFINNKRFSIINVSGVDTWKDIDISRKIKFRHVFEGVVRIIDNRRGIITPSVIYGISEETGVTYKIELIDHYGINQTRVGEKYFIRGKLFENLSLGELIIIIAFWNNTEQSFNLLR